MILEEINSFFVNDERETIEVEFTITEENLRSYKKFVIYLKIPIGMMR